MQQIAQHELSSDFNGVPSPPTGTPLRLSDLRERLIRQEETIIFSLIERAQFKSNDLIYTPHAFELPVSAQGSNPTSEHASTHASTRTSERTSERTSAHTSVHTSAYTSTCDGTFSQFILFELEKVFASVRRYTSPDEHPFCPISSLPDPVLPPLVYPDTLVDNDINVNSLIEKVYRKSIIPSICESGDDQNYGSSAVCDAACLQALSKRIHYGKFIAEAKCQANETLYAKLAADNNKEQIWKELSDLHVEERLLQRVDNKARSYGRDITDEGVRDVYKVKPSIISQLYKDFIIPLTKDVEVKYIIHRYQSA